MRRCLVATPCKLDLVRDVRVRFLGLYGWLSWGEAVVVCGTGWWCALGGVGDGCWLVVRMFECVDVGVRW